MPPGLNWNPQKIQKPFRRKLLRWYGANRRDLPWRRTRDPYRIWVSEVMLQQTRVAAVLEHYRKFLQALPTVRQLAAATEADVLAQWSGLGYYRRARMLHAAAKVLAQDHRAQIPSSAAELQTLPGIGRYTANAIASIAFGERAAVVDGNVERVICRMSCGAVSGENIWTVVHSLLDPQNPGDFNQAMMELGATVCVPGVPNCARCPVKALCHTHCTGSNPDVRVKRELRVRRSASVLLVLQERHIALRKRSAAERLMPAMWELPESGRPRNVQPLLALKHAITNTDWRITVFAADSASLAPVSRTSRKHADAPLRWVPIDEVSRLPLTGLTRKVLRKLKLLA